ncbi:MAG: Anion-transporting ATPase [Frankiales bacterium]|jgi:anion-transporting  ArsA/GET3 family ATPase|nr:Anion-transporting ATPase [Frankiales bacterium]
MSARKPPLFDVDAVLDTASILVCTGSGGVGKTTTAAALALRAAERGRRTVVLTIDPAKRLAQSMGLSELDNTPRRVEGADRSNGGSLDAMMLDMKRTFDEIVLTHAEPGKAEAIFANPFYQALSTSFAGTQEYMAMEKLGQLQATGDYDLVVVDTPPTRSALDFLDAPERMTTFLDGRMIRILLAPAKAGGKVYVRAVTAGFSVFTNVLTKIIGAGVLQDVSQFVGALETMFGGFRERAQATYDLLKAPGTSFVVVAAPERDALREAAYFVERLAEESMPLAGLVVNRVHRSSGDLTAERARVAAQSLEEFGGHELASAVLRLHADRTALSARERRLQERFSGAHPGVPVVEVAALPGDVHDLEGLRAVGADMAGGQAATVPGVPA